MSTLGASIVVKGELRSTEDLTIEGSVEGAVFCEDGSVIVAASAHVGGDILARDITIFGHSSGQLIATEVVDVRPSAAVTGQVMAPRFILDEAAFFQGRVAPQMLEAAVRVARFQQRSKVGEIGRTSSGGAA
ncbi:MAG TPA: polymer-forming cytoskeletal protein [Vicinamibacterales bacterium]